MKLPRRWPARKDCRCERSSDIGHIDPGAAAMRTTLLRFVPLFTLLALAATAGDDHAGVLILKDGTTLIGKIRREGQTILEGGQMVKIGNGFWALDDDRTLPERKDFYVRRYVYSQRLVQGVEEEPAGKPNEWVVLRQPLTPFSTAARI
jgi:hypothetical protein